MSPIIGGTGGGSFFGSFNPAKMAGRMSSRMMNDLDANKNQSIDKNEFVTSLAAKGISSADASKMFDAIDTKKSGSITRDDIETAVKTGAIKPPAGSAPPRGAGKSGGPPPGGQAGGGAAAQAYDPADTNQDGTVSAKEALVYSFTHTTKSVTTMTDSSLLGNRIDAKA